MGFQKCSILVFFVFMQKTKKVEAHWLWFLGGNVIYHFKGCLLNFSPRSCTFIWMTLLDINLNMLIIKCRYLQVFHLVHTRNALSQLPCGSSSMFINIIKHFGSHVLIQGLLHKSLSLFIFKFANKKSSMK